MPRSIPLPSSACCSGLLLTKERRDVAIKLWDEMNSQKANKTLSAEEGLALLAKLKGAFAEVADSIPECGICLMEMEEADGIVLAKCGHVFCKLCIQRVSNKKCPYCRAVFDQSDIVNMVQAAKASKSSTENIPEDELKFGVPPKIQALFSSIQGMQTDEKGGEQYGMTVDHYSHTGLTMFMHSRSHLLSVYIASQYHRKDHEGSWLLLCAYRWLCLRGK